jgi:hypothetical protein
MELELTVLFGKRTAKRDGIISDGAARFPRRSHAVSSLEDESSNA